MIGSSTLSTGPHTGVAMPVCSACRASKPKVDYSKSQLKRKSHRKCKLCCGATSSGASTATSTYTYTVARSAAPHVQYVVEHLEEGFHAGGWCALEYSHILSLGGNSRVMFTNISPDHQRLLPDNTRATSVSIANLHEQHDEKALADTSARLQQEGLPVIDRSRVCFLDMRADQGLEPADAALFDYLVVGGVLGDHPPKDRCAHVRAIGYPIRHLGARQMTTDTAVLTCKLILEGGRTLQSMQFVDDPEVSTGLMDSTQLPFRYLVDGTQHDPADRFPYLAPGMLDCLADSVDMDLGGMVADVQELEQDDIDAVAELLD